MKFIKFFVNPSAESPTAGFRGMLVLAIAAAFSFLLDWPSDWLVLFVVVMGALVTSLGLFSEAARNLDK